MARPRTNVNAIIRDAAFAKRLLKACEDHPEVPAFGQGQQTWIRDRLGVSGEGVRKWFAGEAKPRSDTMRQLAKLLEVDEAWLSLGIAPETGPKEQKARNAMADGAVNVVAGIIQMNGGSPAFLQDTDPRSKYIDLYTIIKGRQYSINVSLAQEISEGEYRFRIPNEYEDCTVIGVIQPYPVRCVFLHIPTPVIDEYRVRKGGYVEITARKDGNEYRVGTERCPRITNFAERI